MVVGHDAGGCVENQRRFFFGGKTEGDRRVAPIGGLLALVATALAESVGVCALDRKGGATLFHCAAHIVAGRAVVAVVAGGAERDFVLFGFDNGHFGGLHHRCVA